MFEIQFRDGVSSGLNVELFVVFVLNLHLSVNLFVMFLEAVLIFISGAACSSDIMFSGLRAC